MSFSEYSNYDGLGLAELVKKKEIKPIELIEAAIERIERLNPQLNAVVFKAFDEAHDGQDRVFRPFHRCADSPQRHSRIQEGLAEPGRLPLRASDTCALRFDACSSPPDGRSHSARQDQRAGIRCPANH